MLDKIKKIAKEMDAENLLELFIQTDRKFNPVDESFIETYNVLKSEIIYRMEKHDKLTEISDKIKEIANVL